MIFRFLLIIWLLPVGHSVADVSFLGKQTSPVPQFSLSEPTFLPVDEAYKFSASVEGHELVIHWDIAEGYYLYRHSMQVATSDQPIELSKLRWSKPGVEKQDDYFGSVLVFYQNLTLRVPVAPSDSRETEFSITYQGCADAGLCYPPQTRLALFTHQNSAKTGESDQLTNFPNLTTAETFSDRPPANSPMSLWMSLGFAFIGGLLLNLMPCVFPVLSLKALKLARASALDHAEHRKQALAYTAGVISLFAGIALIMMMLKAGGESIGWGFQLQSPWFVGLMVYVFFILGLSLTGWLELGTGLMGIGDSLTSKKGHSGAFFTGVLAVLVASPCTAPFMGSALGYGMTLPGYQSLMIFVALGFGMALPFLIIGFVPAASALLPKPGAWMETFKQFLAFPMFLSSLWLLWVLGRQTGVTGMSWELLGLISLTLALWTYKLSQSRQGVKRFLGLVITLLCAAFSLWILGSPPLNPTAKTVADNTKGAALAFSEDELQRALTTGKTVFVNVTADWCVSCLVNEQTVLANEPVSSLLASDDITYLKADWTNADPSIANYLATFGRNGVPLYVVYQHQQPPRLLPQLLSTHEVVSALQKVD